MLNNIRNTLRALTAPSFLSHLRQFNIKGIRNPQYPECKSGMQTWIDISRDSSCIINGKAAGLSQLVKQYNANNPNQLRGNEYRRILYKMFNSKFHQISGKKVAQPLVQECITLLNQSSLHGSLNVTLMQKIGEDIKDRICPDKDIYPRTKNFTTTIQVISHDTLRISYKEETEYKNTSADEQETICQVNGTLSFNITMNKGNEVIYHNPIVSIEAPLAVSSHLFSPRFMMTTSILEKISNVVRRLYSYITNTPLPKTPSCEITQYNNFEKLTYQLSGSYLCNAITSSEEKPKEKNVSKKTKDQSRDNIPTTKMEKLKVQPQEKNNKNILR